MQEPIGLSEQSRPHLHGDWWLVWSTSRAVMGAVRTRFAVTEHGDWWQTAGH